MDGCGHFVCECPRELAAGVGIGVEFEECCGTVRDWSDWVYCQSQIQTQRVFRGRIKSNAMSADWNFSIEKSGLSIVSHRLPFTETILDSGSTVQPRDMR